MWKFNFVGNAFSKKKYFFSKFCPYRKKFSGAPNYMIDTAIETKNTIF